MYAVFEDGSRQYRVSEGDVVKVDYREAEVGARLEFNRVLLYQGAPEGRIGQPTVEGMRVLADVVDHPSTKLYIQHFRRRKNYRRLRGHRQPYTSVRIRHILLPGMEPPPPGAETPAAPAAQSTPATPPAPPAPEAGTLAASPAPSPAPQASPASPAPPAAGPEAPATPPAPPPPEGTQPPS